MPDLPLGEEIHMRKFISPEDALNGIDDSTVALAHRQIFIHRDYTRGDGVRFSTEYPLQLEGHLEREQFEQIIHKINSLYSKAEMLSPRSVVESVVGCLTAYTLFLCVDTQYDRALKEVSKFIRQQNLTLNRAHGITIVDPMERGLRVMEIKINAQFSR